MATVPRFRIDVDIHNLLLPRALRPRLHRLLQLPIYVGAGCNSAFRLQWPYQTHPHWQRTDSHNWSLCKSALQMAH